MSRWQVHQTDKNEPAIREFLETFGATVIKLHQPVDLLIFYRGVVALAEVKMPGEPLRASQDAFLRTWPGVWCILTDELDCRWLLSVMTPQTPQKLGWGVMPGLVAGDVIKLQGIFEDPTLTT